MIKALNNFVTARQDAIDPVFGATKVAAGAMGVVDEKKLKTGDVRLESVLKMAFPRVWAKLRDKSANGCVVAMQFFLYCLGDANAVTSWGHRQRVSCARARRSGRGKK